MTSRMIRRLALIYGQQGPWISTKGMRRPRLQVSGLREKQVQVHIQGLAALVFTDDGMHPLPEAEWMRVEYLGECQGPICIIKGEAA